MRALSPIDRMISELEARGLTVGVAGPQKWTAQCPAHEDRNASLSIDVGDDERVLVCCHAGCETDDILRALGLETRDLFANRREQRNGRPSHSAQRGAKREPRPLPAHEQLSEWQQHLHGHERALDRLRELRGWTPEALANLGVGYDGERVVFPIRDRAGKLVNVCRYTPSPKNGDRKMLALAGRPRDLFPAPETLSGDVAWIVEGEGDAVAAATLGLPATGLPGVEAAKRLDVGRFRRFSRVNLLLDCDWQGREAAGRIAAALTDAGIEVRVVDLDPSRDDGYDLSAWTCEAAADGSEGLAHAARVQLGMADASAPAALSDPERSRNGRRLAAESFDGIRAERTRWLWKGRIPLGTVTLLVGREKLGKSTLTNMLAAELSRGTLAGDLEGQAAGTLFVSYEDSAARTIKPRLLAAGADLLRVHRVLATYGDARDLVSLPDDVAKIGELAREQGSRLVVVDPLSASLNGEIDGHRDQHVRRALAPLDG